MCTNAILECKTSSLEFADKINSCIDMSLLSPEAKARIFLIDSELKEIIKNYEGRIRFFAANAEVMKTALHEITECFEIDGVAYCREVAHTALNKIDKSANHQKVFEFRFNTSNLTKSMVIELYEAMNLVCGELLLPSDALKIKAGFLYDSYLKAFCLVNDFGTCSKLKINTACRDDGSFGVSVLVISQDRFQQEERRLFSQILQLIVNQGLIEISSDLAVSLKDTDNEQVEEDNQVSTVTDFHVEQRG